MTRVPMSVAGPLLWSERRALPSGDVHLVAAVAELQHPSGGLVVARMRCGKEWPLGRLTGSFPAGARRCRLCTPDG